ncbi:VCBS repeat-containing protein, partial [candidate division WOR-3 bacterium]|nr:VCBS repeat-containing protein [candidate division WOR-3 bacterium]
VFIRDDSLLHAFYQYRLLDSTPLNVGANSQPAVADWDGDGRKDLLLGTETGYINFYHNFGTDSWPMFQTFEQVHANGSAIYLYRVNPVIFDLDGDNRQDLICGANDGCVRFYRNTGTNAMPVLAAEETLRLQDETPIQPIGTYQVGSRCGFGDWNNDGWPDFLMSGYEGMVQLHLGLPFVGVEEGSRHEPALPAQSVVASASRPAVVRVPALVGGQRVVVADAAGRPAAEFGTAPDGRVVWECGGVAPGVYFCRLTGPTRPLARIVVAR